MSIDVSATISTEQVKREGIGIIDMYVLNASSSGFDPLYFANWNQDVRDNINNGVRSGLLTSQNKNYILSEFTKVIKMLLGIPSNKQITEFLFRSDGIHVIY